MQPELGLVKLLDDLFNWTQVILLPNHRVSLRPVFMEIPENKDGRGNKYPKSQWWYLETAGLKVSDLQLSLWT